MSNLGKIYPYLAMILANKGNMRGNSLSIINHSSFDWTVNSLSKIFISTGNSIIKGFFWLQHS